MANKPVNILIVDDSVIYRKALSQITEELPRANLLGTAPNGRIALKKIEAMKPDLVLLDHEMPEMTGLETLNIIKKKFPDVSVVMISGQDKQQTEMTMNALESGALDFIPKPDRTGFEGGMAQIRNKIRSILRLMEVRQNTAKAHSATKAVGETQRRTKRQRPHEVKPKQAIGFAETPTRFDVIAIGASTGGPEALNKLIPALPANLGVPVLLVQHMPPLFTATLANNLNRKSALTVKEAEEGEIIQKNVVYIAPGGKHMVVAPCKDGKKKQFQIFLNDEPPVNSCRPSVDTLFQSIATVYEGNVLATILTGMGYDGQKGVIALKSKGCYCISQDEASCVVYGMPRAIDEKGLSDSSVPLAEIPKYIVSKIHPLNR